MTSGSYVFLAAEVVASNEPETVPFGAVGPVMVRQRMEAEITLRMYDSTDDCVYVMDFRTFAGAIPALMRTSRERPTADDRAYLEALEDHDIRPVDVRGCADHSPLTDTFVAMLRSL